MKLRLEQQTSLAFSLFPPPKKINYLAAISCNYSKDDQTPGTVKMRKQAYIPLRDYPTSNMVIGNKIDSGYWYNLVLGNLSKIVWVQI